MADDYRDVIRLLQENGYEFKRPERGDHEIWWQPRTGVRVTVERKLTSYFAAHGILKEAGFPKAF